jgi:hypothetical protein
MKVYTKNYIGHGNKITTKAGKKLPIVKMTLSMEELQKNAHTYSENGKDYVTFEVALMQKPDKYKHTHTVYSTITTETEETAPEESTTVAEPAATETPKRRTRRTKAEIAADKAAEEAAKADMPF